VCQTPHFPARLNGIFDELEKMSKASDGKKDWDSRRHAQIPEPTIQTLLGATDLEHTGTLSAHQPYERLYLTPIG
jgi:hypothetical protein